MLFRSKLPQSEIYAILTALGFEHQGGRVQPPTWQIAQVLRQLQRVGERGWPNSDAQWRELLARAVVRNESGKDGDVEVSLTLDATAEALTPGSLQQRIHLKMARPRPSIFPCA